MPIRSMADLPKDVRERESATFDFGKVKTLLTEAYYRGPAIHEDDSKKGLRARALRGNPSSHRKSILKKATETNLLMETSEGYATTSHGYELLNQMTVCETCGQDEEPFGAGIRTGKYSGYYAVLTKCPSCEDPTGADNVTKHVRDEDELEEAVRVMESQDVICYLNGKSIDRVKQDLRI